MESSSPLLRFDNTFLSQLPTDSNEANRVRQVFGACHTRVKPTPVATPRLVAASSEMVAELGLPSTAFDNEALSDVFAGNRLLPGMDPYAACYGGHQFGGWAGQLGDGRAISLGEAITPSGARLELQLKGAGRTPYSRTADGRAVMRSSVREFLCSEAMHHLGVPTTRALCLVSTGESVVRDILYDGNPRPEPGAVVCRVAPTFIRFGNFEILAARRDVGLLRALCNYTIRTHFAELGTPEIDAEADADLYVRWFAEICRRTATMIVHWMRVGFVHGVMNTDNMSILGLTIDYGPYGFVEAYDPTWTPNITDAQGRRYRYGNQPRVAFWNLVQLANALVPVVGEPGPLEEALKSFTETFEERQSDMLRAKLGLQDAQAEDGELVEELLRVLTLSEIDMTIFFRRLALVNGTADQDRLAVIEPAFYEAAGVGDEARSRLTSWLSAYATRVRAEGGRDEDRRTRMNAVNPKFVLRNYVAQLAIDDAEKGDFARVRELLDVMRRPYDEQPDKQMYAEKRPEWARNRAGCSMLSCSS